MPSHRHPQIVAVVAFLVFALSLSWGPTASSLPLTAKVAGWDWQPMTAQPLLWLFTLPLRFLPAGWIAVALNLLFAALAAATLGLVARSVQLLPWDKSWNEENRLGAALPITLAAILCGLEFNFWSEATAATGEMLDLFVLALPVWLLLEYRAREASLWLMAAAFFWGVGMAENWVMMLTLPIFVGSLIWLRGRRFFRLRFLLRMAVAGLAGFLIYALLPLVNSLLPHSPWGAGEAWLISLRQTKNIFVMLHQRFWLTHRLMSLAVLVYFLVPLLPCLVQLRNLGQSAMDRFQVRVYRLLQLALLLACFWLAQDPANGPRQIIEHQFGGGLPLLTFDYLNTLGAAFLAGNLLLLFQSASGQRRRSGNKKYRSQWILGGSIGLLVLLAAGMAFRNGPAILRVNEHPLRGFGELAVQSLPAGRGLLLSDYPERLAVFQSALSHHPNRGDWLPVDTRALPKVAYRAGLERRQPAGWLTAANRHELTALETLQLLEHLAGTNRLFYLHPSYGYFFERFYLAPVGLIYQMNLRAPHDLENPALTETTVATNETFWTHCWQKHLVDLIPPARPPRSGPMSALIKKIPHLGLTPVSHNQDRLLAEWYSSSLDAWGVALARLDRRLEAQLRFQQALQLNSNNLSARISLTCNTNQQAGITMGLAGVEQVSGQLGSLQHLGQIMNNWGPFDEPVFCYLLGCAFQEGGLLLQAAQQFERTCKLAPGVPAPELALAQIYNRLQRSDQALLLIHHVREEIKKQPASQPLDLELALLEAGTWRLQTNRAQAEQVLETVLQQYPEAPAVANGVMNAYWGLGDFTNALRIITTQLARSPDNVTNLNNQAALLIQSGNPAAAIPVLDHLLRLADLPSARLNRAIACLAAKDFTAAEKDYRELETARIAPAQVGYGLATIADHRHDTNQIRHYLEICLTNSYPGTLLWLEASNHLQILRVAPKT